MTATPLATARISLPARSRPAELGASGSVRDPSRGGDLRLTRRGRLVVTLTLLAAVAVVAVLFSSGSVATGQAGAPEATRTVVVERGDTLWQIAADVAPAGQVREMVHRIEKLNALPGPALAEGQEIAVPLR